MLLVFLPKDDTAAAGRGAAGARAPTGRSSTTSRLSAFVVVRDPATAATAQDMRGLRWFLDQDGAVSRLYGALDADGAESPMWLLLDPALRVIGRVQLANAQMMFDTLARLPPPAEHAGVPLHAPVLIVPRIFEPELCAAADRACTRPTAAGSPASCATTASAPSRSWTS